MNNKGQMVGAGALVVIAIAIIVATTLLSGSGGIAHNAAELTNKRTVLNQSLTLAAAGGYTDIDACVNYDISYTPVLHNITDGSAVPTTNYTFTTRISPTSSLKVLTVKMGVGSWASTPTNASYICLPQGYAEDAGSRAIVPLIVLLACLALAVIVILPIADSVRDYA